MRAKTRKRKGDSESDFTEHIRNSQCQSCPVCHGRLQRTPEEIAQHVEDCLRKVSNFFVSRIFIVYSYLILKLNCSIKIESEENK